MTDDGSVPNLQVEVLSGGLYPYWDEPSPAPDGYRVMWVIDGQPWSTWRTTGGHFLHNGFIGNDGRYGIVLGTGILDSGVTYRIQVRATYGDGGANANN